MGLTGNADIAEPSGKGGNRLRNGRHKKARVGRALHYDSLVTEVDCR